MKTAKNDPLFFAVRLFSPMNNMYILGFKISMLSKVTALETHLQNITAENSPLQKRGKFPPYPLQPRHI